MSCDDWFEVLADAKNNGFQGVQFIGGEPTLHPDLDKLIGYARKVCDFKYIELYSNFSNSLNWEFLAEMNVALATSFYSKDKYIHNLIVRHGNGYEKIVNNLNTAIALKFPLRVAVIEMLENFNCTDETVHFLKHLGVKDIRIDKVRKIGRACTKNSSFDDLDRQLCGACGINNLMINNEGDVYPCIMSTHRWLGNVLERQY